MGFGPVWGQELISLERMGLCPKGCSKIEFDSNGIISKKIQEQELLGYNSKSPKRESFLRGDSKEMF